MTIVQFWYGFFIFQFIAFALFAVMILTAQDGE